MYLKTAAILILLFFILRGLLSLYNLVLYPLIQFLKQKNEFGYVLTKHGELEHRRVVKKIIKRSLTHGEEIHHINGKKWDNRKSNLALLTRSNHKKWHKRLRWMFDNKNFPSIKWQKNKLIEEFEAKVF